MRGVEVTRIGFEQPGFFFWAAALAVLLALYLWYRRSRRRETTALFLWDKPETSPHSGSRFTLHRLPLSFFLEALAVLFLTAAAAAPFIMLGESYPPLAVIMDNSYSMQAVPPGGTSPRRQGEEYLSEYLKRFPGRRVIRISAGTVPRLVADGREDVPAAAFGQGNDLRGDLAGAAALARSLSAHAEILIITDHAPDFPLTDDISWFSAGSPLPNMALVNVRRQEDRVLVEAANFAAFRQRARIVLAPGGGSEWFTLAPDERRKIALRLPVAAEKSAAEIRLETGNDPLVFDNRAVLESDVRAPLSYRFGASLPESARQSLGEVLRENPAFTDAGEPELLFDIPGKAAGRYHRLLWHGAESPDSVLASGLISALSGRELIRGLPLQDLRWAALPDADLPGEVLIRCGGMPLLSEVRRADGFRDIHLNLNPAHSNLARRPFWPVFFWNLADELRRARPGPEYANYRSGETVRIRLPDPGPLFLALRQPDGSESRIEPVGRHAYFIAGASGIYDIDGRWRLAVSALDSAESDLRGAASFRRQSTALPDASEFPRRHLAFVFLLAALAVLMFHQYKLGKAGRGV